MARLGLTSLPLVSLTRRVPGRTVNTLRDNILSCHYWFVEVFLLTHLKLCRQLEREKAAVWHFCGSGQQEEIFYSMAATIVRLEESGYRRSWREAFLFLPLSGVFRRATHHPSHGVTYILFSPPTSMLGCVSERPSFKSSLLRKKNSVNVLNTVLLRSEGGRGESRPYVTGPALR